MIVHARRMRETRGLEAQIADDELADPDVSMG